MISFEDIDKHSRIYAVLLNLMNFAHNYIFYDEVVIIGKENIPSKGEPCFSISNHQNGLMDPLAKLNMFEDQRQPIFIARGDIFKKDTIAKLLKFAKILPTFRTRDGDRSDIRRNNDTFSTAGGVLSRGGTVILYPEAQHQHGRYLGEFKKGFPRICFAAEEISNYELHLKILPVCLHYTNYERIGAKLLIIIGKPFTFEEFYDIHKTDPNVAFQKLNEKTRSILKEMVMDITDQEHYNQYDTLRLMISRNRLASLETSYNFHQNFIEEKKVIEEIDTLKEQNSEKFHELMIKTEQYQRDLKKLNFRDWLINSDVTWVTSLLKDFGLLLLLPFFIFSIINNGVLYFTPEYLVKKMKDRQLFSTVRFALGFLLSPVWYLILLILVWVFSYSFLVALIWVVVSVLMFKLIYYWQKEALKLFHTYRYLLLSRSKGVQNLKQLKEEIVNFF